MASPKRVRLFLLRGLQLRYAFLVAGSLLVLLIFTGFHGVFLTTSSLPEDVLETIRPELLSSTGRLFVVGTLYILVVTLAATFLTHRAVGPVGRLEKEISEIVDSSEPVSELKVREGDELVDLVRTLNKLIKKVRKK